MDESEFGKEDSRGYWEPDKKIQYPPLLIWPSQPVKLLKWIFGFPGFLLPWNVFYSILALLIWQFLTPSLDTMQSFALSWVAIVLLRNYCLAFAVYGTWHLWLYTWKKQDTHFKYNRAWPKKQSSVFLFNHQTADNMFWTLASGVPIWTAYEVLLLWAYSSGLIPFIDASSSPLLFVAIFLLVPFIHEIGFYVVHRTLHWPPLYKIAHKLHHRNTNPGPWSGLSMHPIEHLMYFSTILLFFFIPSHPVHMINLASRLGLAPGQGHTGFDRLALGKDKSVDASYYAHYLHHRYFEVNYADGMVPLDKWFGSFHNGSAEAHEAMKARRMRRGV